jgi:hypothetical protein
MHLQPTRVWAIEATENITKRQNYFERNTCHECKAKLRVAPGAKTYLRLRGALLSQINQIFKRYSGDTLVCIPPASRYLPQTTKVWVTVNQWDHGGNPSKRQHYFEGTTRELRNATKRSQNELLDVQL